MCEKNLIEIHTCYIAFYTSLADFLISIRNSFMAGCQKLKNASSDFAEWPEERLYGPRGKIVVRSKLLYTAFD